MVSQTTTRRTIEDALDMLDSIRPALAEREGSFEICSWSEIGLSQDSQDIIKATARIEGGVQAASRSVRVVYNFGTTELTTEEW